MSKQKKILLGILTFVPFILFIVGIVAVFALYFTILTNIENQGQGDLQPSMIAGFGAIWLLMALAGLTSFGLMIYYVIDTINDKSIESNERIIWVLVLILLSGMGNIVYWFVRINGRKPTVKASDDFLDKY